MNPSTNTNSQNSGSRTPGTHTPTPGYTFGHRFNVSHYPPSPWFITESTEMEIGSDTDVLARVTDPVYTVSTEVEALNQQFFPPPPAPTQTHFGFNNDSEEDQPPSYDSLYGMQQTQHYPAASSEIQSGFVFNNTGLDASASVNSTYELVPEREMEILNCLYGHCGEHSHRIHATPQYPHWSPLAPQNRANGGYYRVISGLPTNGQGFTTHGDGTYSYASTSSNRF